MYFITSFLLSHLSRRPDNSLLVPSLLKLPLSAQCRPSEGLTRVALVLLGFRLVISVDSMIKWQSRGSHT